MSVVCDYALIGRIDRAKPVVLVAGRVETNNRADVAATANEALREPALISLVTHRR